MNEENKMENSLQYKTENVLANKIIVLDEQPQTSN